jgi:hypothetical protein
LRHQLIEKLNSKLFKKWGHYWNDEEGVLAKAYTDDILLSSNSYEYMVELVGAVKEFNFHLNIQFNPKKCEILK